MHGIIDGGICPNAIAVHIVIELVIDVIGLDVLDVDQAVERGLVVQDGVYGLVLVQVMGLQELHQQRVIDQGLLHRVVFHLVVVVIVAGEDQGAQQERYRILPFHIQYFALQFTIFSTFCKRAGSY